MNSVDILYNEYEELKSNYLKTNSLNLKENVKEKLIELDYEINKNYDEVISRDFPMTTTIEKEGIRLERLIAFIEKKKDEQNKLIEDYKKITGLTIELSHLKHTDKLVEYKMRLELVKEFIRIKKDLIKLINDGKEVNDIKINILKTRLMKKDMLNLLYEFCLIDNLDITDINVEKIIKEQKTMPKEENKKIDVNLVKKEEKIEEESKVTNEEVTTNKEELLTSMPKIDKLGTVTPVNVFETVKKVQEKLPDVVIPTNGLTDESAEIFVNTENYFN